MMLSATRLEDIAARVRGVQLEGGQLPPLTSSVQGFDLAAGYAVADLVKRKRVEEGAVPVGRKIGFTNSELWPLFGVRHPIWGYLYDETVVDAAAADTPCSLSGLLEPKIEPEIVLHFHTAPPAAEPEALLACIDWVAHGFEIVQSHFPGWKFEAPDTVADGALHGRLLLGEPVPVAQLAADPADALASLSLALFRDGQELERGRGANVLGSPLAAAAHLVEVLSGQPGYPPLRGGEMVTTGSITKAYPVGPGETWRTTLQGAALPGLSVTFHA